MLGRVNTPPEEFENGGFNLKTHQIFFVHTTTEEFKKASFTAQLSFCLTKTLSGNHLEKGDIIKFLWF